MNFTVSSVEWRGDGAADYWLVLEHISGVSWEVPVSRAELEKLQPWLPKALRTLAKRGS